MTPPVRREIRLTTGYFDCKKRIERLKRFQNLLRHREKWTHQLDFAPPLERLIPEISESIPDQERSGYMPNLSRDQIRAMREPALIDREINHLIPMVYAYLNAVNVETVYTHTALYRDFDDSEQSVSREVERRFDAVSDYFSISRLPGIRRGEEFELLLALTDRGIGIYEARLKVAKHEMFNPLIWIATMLRAPLYVLERAGFDESPGAVQSAVFQIYSWSVRLLVVIVLALVAARLGVSIPWRQIAAFFR
jgi:hypothetical protein